MNLQVLYDLEEEREVHAEEFRVIRRFATV